MLIVAGCADRDSNAAIGSAPGDPVEHRSCAFVGNSPPRDHPADAGAQLGIECEDLPVRIIPACVGSTSRRAAARPRSRHRPCRRGEHDPQITTGRTRLGSSPQTREHEKQIDDDVILLGYPRRRGEHTGNSVTSGRPSGSSPQTRGARESCHQTSSTVRIIPADAGEHQNRLLAAGVSRGPSPQTRGTPRAPREHLPRVGIIPADAGKRAGSAGFGLGVRGSSPQTRGTHRDPVGRGYPPGIIPADAGNTNGIWTFVEEWHGSSPQTRGTPGSMSGRSRPHRIIPADAGNTGGRVRAAPTSWDHPRRRGEHLECDLGHVQASGSSPQTRGTLPRHGDRRTARGIIPADAGNTRPNGAATARSRDHPRRRGEHCLLLSRRHRGAGSSPQTRGTHRRAFRDPCEFRIIPADAGNTCAASAARSAARDHPRRRGEHLASSSRISPRFRRRRDHPRRRGEHTRPSSGRSRPVGSSPQTRGTRGPGAGPRGQGGIIPADAGNTLTCDAQSSTSWDHPRRRGEHTW